MRKILIYNTSAKAELTPITKDIKKLVKKSKIKNGTLFAYSMHTTLSLIIQETAEPNLCQDIINQLNKMVDDDAASYKHSCALHPSGTCESDSANGPSHVRQVLTNQNIILDIKDGELVIGKWQDIGLLELDGPRKNRKVNVKIIKD